jgi:hypothetical protein
MRTDEEWLGNASESGSVAERETLTSKRSQEVGSFLWPSHFREKALGGVRI